MSEELLYVNNLRGKEFEVYFDYNTFLVKVTDDMRMKHDLVIVKKKGFPDYPKVTFRYLDFTYSQLQDIVHNLLHEKKRSFEAGEKSLQDKFKGLLGLQ